MSKRASCVAHFEGVLLCRATCRRIEFLTHFLKRPLSAKSVWFCSNFGRVFDSDLGCSSVLIEESLRVRMLSVRID
jgi:hypothetical protein